MKSIILTKNGKVIFDTDKFYLLYNENNPVYKAVKACFNDWINDQPEEVRSMYFEPMEELHGETYLDHKGAVIGGIDHLVAYINEKKLTRTNTKIFYTAGVTDAFEPNII